MASRKEQKEQARAERLAAEQANQAKAAQTRRIQIFGGVIVAAVIVIVAVVALTSGGNGTTTKVQSLGTGKTHKVSNELKTIDQTVSAELQGIPQSGVTLGSPSAKVTMLYFGDLQCPICADFTTGAGGGGLPQFIADQVKTGHVKVVYHSFCTATCSTSNPAPGGGSAAFTRQQVAAYAAGEQDKFWNFTEIFYREQGAEDSGYVTPAFIRGIAEQIPGLNTITWQTDRGQSPLSEQVTADENLATKYGLDGTPSLIMKGPKGEELVNNGNFSDYQEMLSAYKQVL